MLGGQQPPRLVNPTGADTGRRNHPHHRSPDVRVNVYPRGRRRGGSRQRQAERSRCRLGSRGGRRRGWRLRSRRRLWRGGWWNPDRGRRGWWAWAKAVESRSAEVLATVGVKGSAGGVAVGCGVGASGIGIALGVGCASRQQLWSRRRQRRGRGRGLGRGGRLRCGRWLGCWRRQSFQSRLVVSQLGQFGIEPADFVLCRVQSRRYESDTYSRANQNDQDSGGQKISIQTECLKWSGRLVIR